MSETATLRYRAENLSATLPSLMVAAEHLATTVVMGFHGRRRSGLGDEFWQYRPAAAGDGVRQIDWRRSARSDAQFVQEKEWQAAQNITLWADDAKSMDFSSTSGVPRKRDRASLLALAAAILLIRGGERVALPPQISRARQGEAQLMRIADALTAGQVAPEYGTPDLTGAMPHSRAVFISDFLGDMGAISEQLQHAAERGIKGAIVQILDPQEEIFPFDGRTIFESVGRSVAHETLKASELRQRYKSRLAARKGALADLAGQTGWQFHCYHTDETAQSALLWIYGAIGRSY